jgi:DNA-binding transcriptional ArsR family regulator
LRLAVIQPSRTARVLPVHVIDYMAFRETFGSEAGENELHMLEKFHAARSMIENGLRDTFVSATLRTIPETNHRLKVDVCGVDRDDLNLVLCETGPADEKLFRSLDLIEDAENANALLLFPSRIDTSEIADRFPEAVESGKIEVQRLQWRERAVDRTFREALEIMDLLGNETRVRMLVPLLEKPYGKRHYRTEINPKLVYENVTSLLTHRLIGELEDDTYGLTTVGRQIFCEYMAFLERVRRVLEENRE